MGFSRLISLAPGVRGIKESSPSLTLRDSSFTAVSSLSLLVLISRREYAHALAFFLAAAAALFPAGLLSGVLVGVTNDEDTIDAPILEDAIPWVIGLTLQLSLVVSVSALSFDESE